MNLRHVFIRRSTLSTTQATTNQGRGWTNLFTVRLSRYSCRLISYLRDFMNLIIYHEQIVQYRSQIFLLEKDGNLQYGNGDV